MAFFGVTLEIIDQILPHPNADRLAIYKMKGLDFEVIAGIGDFQLGQKVLYFPIDLIIPNDVLRKIGLEGKLKGKDKNRLGMAKFRGVYSKGLIISMSLLDNCTFQTRSNTKEQISTEITAYLGVTKYDPPISSIKGGIHAGDCSGKLPDGLGKYDIEAAERYPEVVKRLMYQEVTVCEKIEGSNASVCWYKNKNKLYVNMHGNSVLPTEDLPEPPYWKMAREGGHLDLVKKLKDKCKTYVAIFSEAVGPGVQGNIYRLKQNKLLAYDIKIDGRFVCKDKFFELIKGVETVPVLCKHTRLIDFLDGKTVQEAADGTSLLYNTAREGIVITPEQEAFCEELYGRTILKMHSPRYLLKGK